ncbi:MAG: transglutaminase-like domain-containing protein [Candidatus Thermoplasmatota archaeon]|nr:transglutaminase-like domain-containing protein [Candidatus Thermoplasmatota archaeon]
MDSSTAPKATPLLTLLFSLFLALIVVTGCLEGLPQLPITYESHPTMISYELEFGYDIDCQGPGRYDITYRCDFPEVLRGTTNPVLLYDQKTTITTRAGNQMIFWNISGFNETTYTLGVHVTVTSRSSLISDISGAGALNTTEIAAIHPNIFSQYTQPQGNTTQIFIDPNNKDIQQIAQQVQTTAQTNNALLLGKALFIWLKTNTAYQIHPQEGGVRPVAQTLSLKNGDCDDLSFLYISLCRAVYLPARFVRGYLLDASTPIITATAHAWTEIYVGGSLGTEGWIPVECACCTPSIDADIHQNFGVEKAQHLRLFTDDGSNTSLDLALTGISVSYAPGKQIHIESFTQLTDYQELRTQKLVVSGDTRSYE